MNRLLRPMASTRVVAFALLASCLTALTPLEAQEVRLADNPRNDAERAVAAFLEGGGYELWASDTVLARSDTVRAHVLVLESSARISGTIEGDVLVVDGDLFMRTGGRISGNLAVLGGGFYDSGLAAIEGTVTYRPNERVRVRPTEGDYEIFSVAAEREPFELDGTWGIHIPVYQRVDAVTLGWGAIARFDDVAGRPDLEGSVRFLTGPAEFEGSIRNSWYTSERLRLGVSGSRETRTMDGWIRPEWYNSLSLLVADDDAFNYYKADRVGLEAEFRSTEPPIWEDAPVWNVTFAAFWEGVGSLDARDTWALFESDVPTGVDGLPLAPEERHPNPLVDDGDFLSFIAGFDWMKRDDGGRIAFGVSLEYAHQTGTVSIPTSLDVNMEYALAEGRVSTRRLTSWGHAWDVFAIGRVVLGGDLAEHRWSTLGGPGTITTMPLRSMYGPEMFYGEATYAVPVMGMASLGGLDVFARATGGSVWGHGTSSDFLASGGGGIAVRMWEFQMETGVAYGAGLDGNRTVWFFDVRTRRSARPTQVPPRGRGF